ncbi:hypothetical protein HDU98_010489, partial [Podochytrium sp. JEL0797]
MFEPRQNIPICVIASAGTIWSACILLVLVRERLVKDTFGKIAATILTASLLLGLFAGGYAAYQLTEPEYSPQLCKSLGGLINGLIAFAWGGQSLLAFERLHLIKYSEDMHASTFYLYLLSLCLVFCYDMLVNLLDPTQTESPFKGQRCIMPQQPALKKLFVAQAWFFLSLFTILVTTFCYSAFVEISTLLRSSANRPAYFKLQKIVLIRCIILSSSLFILYSPALLIFSVQVFGGRWQDESEVLLFFARVWPSLDLVVMPSLILALQENYRHA